ncbi:effector-binding domain-containing protein [Herbihabitans rhizosphaerae]|uniref:Effector-binding domain-containing protein n=1 Tax=Herbihabitans rhizosphaerae TaxID=1872711 RepID=A0A4Q7KNL2_9PSEU|nr:GyrI-like domain-containing protein [Herbihabitans rhizosphaerae]RZS37560.1 effector-binding domain-containing protein [Herbihabitans rhizosphaerae]
MTSTRKPVGPQVVHREEQPYVAIGGPVTMHTIHTLGDRLQAVYGWLHERGIEAAGPPFFRYRRIHMERELDVEAGVPVPAAVEPDSSVIADMLPAGQFLTATHIGPPSELFGANAALLAWADERGLVFDRSDSADGERWGCRLEFYRTDPLVEPDTAKWETELAFRLAD